jgi:hypothetical protein
MFLDKTGPKEWPVQVAKLKLLTVDLYQRKLTHRRQSKKIFCFKNITVNVNHRYLCSFLRLPFLLWLLSWGGQSLVLVTYLNLDTYRMC